MIYMLNLFKNKVKELFKPNTYEVRYIDKYLNTLTYFQENRLINFKYKLDNNNHFRFEDIYQENYNTTYPDNFSSTYLSKHELEFLTLNIQRHNLSPNLTTNDINGQIEYVMKVLSPVIFDTPHVAFIPTLRYISNQEVKESVNLIYNGSELIETLVKFQNPAPGMDADGIKFDNVTKLVRSVLNNQNIKLEVQHDHEKLIVNIDNKRFPLENLGTGIEQVINIGTYATANENHIFCIEEPETNLHPELQRKLINYLSKYTNNQYFISTHSSHILDTPDASIFHIIYEDNQTIVEKPTSSNDLSILTQDLGYRASDLLQSNCIIWVEGPSDKIYLNYWITNFASELIERIHYTIMFYGGNLLSHLTAADDSEVAEFIDLLKINRNSVIMMDSDKENEIDEINETKKRIEKEFNKLPKGFAWVTKGREIENYIDANLIQSIVKDIHKDVDEFKGNDKFSKIYQFKRNKDTKYKSGTKYIDADKVKLAKKITESSENYDPSILDLKEKIGKLVGFIKLSNGIEN